MFRALALIVCLLPAAAVAQKAVRVPVDFKLELVRGECAGSCPVYTLTIDANGRVHYTGEAYTDKPGMWTKTLDAQTMGQLTRTLRKEAFFSYDSLYNDPRLPALPWLYLQVTEEGRTHRVRFRANGPETFRLLVRKLEAIIGEDGYEPHPTAR